MAEPESRPEHEELWRFSLAFYDQPGVAEVLIALQDRDGRNVNLVLFALWLGISGRGSLDSGLLAAAAQTADALGSEIVEPLRALRRKLRDHPDGDVQKLREAVKAVELAGEKLIQQRLARLSLPPRISMPPADRAAAACTNLALYLRPEGVRTSEAAVIRTALDAFALASEGRASVRSLAGETAVRRRKLHPTA
jgi:uncharacterized protein (TIGR02444 family)